VTDRPFASLKSTCVGTHPFADVFRRTCDELQVKHDHWVKKLRAYGVKAALPDDGWVNRGLNEVQFVYPFFNDGCGVGDRIALGSHDRFRFVVLLERVPPTFMLGDGDERWRFRPEAPDVTREDGPERAA